jgi:hypothetical protein
MPDLLLLVEVSVVPPLLLISEGAAPLVHLLLSPSRFALGSAPLLD